MLTTIVFFFALLSSLIIPFMGNEFILKINQKEYENILHIIGLVIISLLWSWLYWLSH